MSRCGGIFLRLWCLPRRCTTRGDLHADAELLVEPEVVRLPLFGRVSKVYLELMQKLGYQLVHFGYRDLLALKKPG